MNQSKNILLIMVDQVICDTLNCYGGTVCQTPNLNKLAERSVKFDAAYTSTSLCSPARASIFSGKWPHQHGMIFNVTTNSYGRENLFPGTTLLGTTLSKAGYQCGYAGKWHIDEKGPAAHGFSGTNIAGYGLPGAEDEYDIWLKEHGIAGGQSSVEISDYSCPTGSIAKTTMPPEYGYDGIVELPAELTPSGFVVDKTVELLDAMQSKPFFITASFWGPHHPALPTREFLALYDDIEITPWDNYGDDLSGKPEIQQRYRDDLNQGFDGDDWQPWAKTIKRHFAFMTMIDWQIGRILERLKTLGLDDNTMIIFSSDHGDTLGCHGGQFDKGPYMYEETYKVPLLIKFPHQTTNLVASSPVLNMDIYATVLAGAGLEVPTECDSVSLLSAATHPEQRFREYTVGQFSGFDVRGLYSQRLIVANGWKYVFNPGGIDELYNLNDDPAELHNLVKSTTAENMKHKLVKLLYNDMEKNSDPLVQYAEQLMEFPKQLMKKDS
jgi:arylsulfatase A-like enzyme